MEILNLVNDRRIAKKFQDSTKYKENINCQGRRASRQNRNDVVRAAKRKGTKRELFTAYA